MLRYSVFWSSLSTWWKQILQGSTPPWGRVTLHTTNTFRFYTYTNVFLYLSETYLYGHLIACLFVQVGKGRDVGLNQIALFEGKVAGGNGEQVLSRDVYRLGQLFDFFRMFSYFYTTIGFYVCTMVFCFWLLHICIFLFALQICVSGIFL